MSVELQDADLELEERVDLPQTQPTQEELAAQARIAQPILAGHRQGKCFVEARFVEDGVAFRRYGSKEDAPWNWSRSSDFNSSFLAYNLLEAEDMIKVTEELILLHTITRELWQSMGKRSRQRYKDLIDRTKKNQRK